MSEQKTLIEKILNKANKSQTNKLAIVIMSMSLLTSLGISDSDAGHIIQILSLNISDPHIADMSIGSLIASIIIFIAKD